MVWGCGGNQKKCQPQRILAFPSRAVRLAFSPNVIITFSCSTSWEDIISYFKSHSGKQVAQIRFLATFASQRCDMQRQLLLTKSTCGKNTKWALKRCKSKVDKQSPNLMNAFMRSDKRAASSNTTQGMTDHPFRRHHNLYRRNISPNFLK